MQASTFLNGQIRCGTVVVNDLKLSTELYTKFLHQRVVEQAYVSPELAQAWGAPAFSGAAMCLLQPQEACIDQIDRKVVNPDPHSSCIRLVQSPNFVQPTPHATTYGWCAYEISVLDVFGLAEQLQDSDFNIVGPPKRMDGISNVIPMQVVGPDEEVLYLNQILHSDGHEDLTPAQYDVDQIFIVVMGAADMDSVTEEYKSQFGFDNSQTMELRYSLINRAYGFDMETKHRLSVLYRGAVPLVEVDQYPIQAKQRSYIDGNLGLGNAMVSIAVDSLDSLPLANAVNQHAREHDGFLYKGARSIVVRGSSNELIELIEYTT